MIATIHGTLQSIHNNHIIVQVGGVGLQVFVPTGVLSKLAGIGHPVSLQTYLVVREDALALYGFLEVEERTIFEMLLGVPSVGPRLALAILNTLSPELLANGSGGHCSGARRREEDSPEGHTGVERQVAS